MRMIFPFNPLNKKEADEPYQKEFLLLKSLGIKCSLFDLEDFKINGLYVKPAIEEDEVVMYRGWMLLPNEYKALTDAILFKGAKPFTSYENYLKCHHINGWYEDLKEFTPKTFLLKNNNELKNNIEKLSINKYFVKDYVKSNSDEKGSIANTVEEAIDIVKRIEMYRGLIEGGVAIREVENFNEDTEVRYFVLNGEIYSPNNKIPEIVKKIALKINAPFYSMDTIKNKEGVIRLVEIGDGQVSDKKDWDLKVFCEIFSKNN